MQKGGLSNGSGTYYGAVLGMPQSVEDMRNRATAPNKMVDILDGSPVKERIL